MYNHGRIWRPVLFLNFLKTGTGSPLLHEEDTVSAYGFPETCFNTVEDRKSGNIFRNFAEYLRVRIIFVLSLSLSLSQVTRVKIQNIV